MNQIINVPKDIGCSSGNLSPAIAISGNSAKSDVKQVLLFMPL